MLEYLTILVQSIDDDGDNRIVIIAVGTILRSNRPNDRRPSWRPRGLIVDDRILESPVCRRHELQEHGNFVAVGLRGNCNAQGAGRRLHGHVLPSTGENNGATGRGGKTAEGDALDKGGMRLNGDDGILVDINSNMEGIARKLGSKSAVVLDEPEGGERLVDELEPFSERLRDGVETI